MDDLYNYKGITANLNTVDHIIISNELFDNYVNSSAFREFSATQTIPNYYSTTSDHIPTSVTFRMTEDLSIVDFPGVPFFHVYPNPTTGELRITNYELRIMDIKIFDVYGRVLSSHHLITTSSHHNIDISSYPAGIYFLRVNGKTVKVVKK
jgi:hypothetical protein